MLGIMIFGGFLSYSTAEQNSAKAETIPIPREVAVLKPVEVPAISIDLNDNKVAVSGTPEVKIDINQKERTITKWRTRTVVEYVVKEAPEVNLVKYSKPTLNINY